MGAQYFSTSNLPSSTGNPSNDWSNPSNLTANDGNYATEGTVGDAEDCYDFNLTVPATRLKNVTITVQVEGGWYHII